MATLTQTLQNTLATKYPFLAVESRRIILKEALQAYVLSYLNNHSLYRHLNFYGGTCLHVVFGLNRLSEDLDFENRAGIDLDSLAGDFVQFFRRSFGDADAVEKIQEGGEGYLRITTKLPVLYAPGLSPLSSELFHLKVEVSWHEQVAVIQRAPLLYYGPSLVAAHFSLDTMMAGKMLAKWSWHSEIISEAHLAGYASDIRKKASKQFTKHIAKGEMRWRILTRLPSSPTSFRRTFTAALGSSWSTSARS